MRRGWLFLMGAGGLLPTWMWAQTHVMKKPETVVRAVGVYEWVGEDGKPSASRLVPVSVYINKQLEDAGVYLARPVPLALETGTVFAVEQAGATRGTLELAYARHVQAAGDAETNDGWLGYGAFKPKPKEPVFAAKKSGPLPQVAVNGGKGPHFSSKGEDGAAKKSEVDRSTAVGGGTTVSAPDMDQPGGQEKSSGGQEKSADERKSGSNDAGSVDPKDDADRPTLKKRTPAQAKTAKKERDQASVTGVGALNDDPDRPNLHRGKPVTKMEEEDLPPLKGLPPGMHQEVAVSDAANRPEHLFMRSWESEAERKEVLAKMEELARVRLTQYEVESGVRPAAPAAASSASVAAAGTKARRRVVALSGPSAVLTGEVLNGYVLSYGGAATYVYVAQSQGAADVMRYVTVVAQQEPQGALKVALSSVTDAMHLDRTPWLRLVDAVDAEASNRASLLFELRAQGTRQFALYRVIGAQAEQVFATGTTP